MSRFVSSLAILTAAAALTGPVEAADWGEGYDMRGPMQSIEPKDWTELGDPADSMGFEFGVRYYYSWGAQDFTSGGSSFTTSDQSHLAEAHLRIEDGQTNTFAKAIGGYSMVIGGAYDSAGVTGAVTDGRIAYAGADLGWNAFGDNDNGMGPLVGYMYWNDSPRTGRTNYTTATSGAGLTYDPTTGQIFFPGNSLDTDLNINALRLGLSARMELGEMFDVTAEAVAVPYAKMYGVLGNHSVPFIPTALGNPSFVKTSETEVNGWGYGAMGELMVGVHPHENVAIRFGGRAWYLQGTYDATYTAAQLSDPVDSDADGIFDTDPAFLNQGYIEIANPFSILRYGLLAELTYKF